MTGKAFDACMLRAIVKELMHRYGMKLCRVHTTNAIDATQFICSRPRSGLAGLCFPDDRDTLELWVTAQEEVEYPNRRRMKRHLHKRIERLSYDSHDRCTTTEGY